MLQRTLRLTLALACFSLAGLSPSRAQTAPAATNTPATNAPAATPPVPTIPLGDIVSQAQTATTKLQQYQASLDPDPVLQSIDDQLPELSQEIENRSVADKRILESTPSLSTLQTAQAAWQSLSDSLATAQTDLSRRVGDLDKMLWDARTMEVTWKATQEAAKKANALPDTLQRIQDVHTLIVGTTRSVQAHQTPIYEMQNRVAAQDKLTQSGLDTVKKAIVSARARLFERTHPPLWEGEALAQPTAGFVAQEKASLRNQLTELKTYLAPKIGAVLAQIFLLALLVMGFYWIRHAIRLRAQDEPDLQQAARIFDPPVATALLLALLATWFLYPGAPRLLLALMGATALVPAVIITRRLIDPANIPILYATMIAYFVDQVRYVITREGILSRLLFIAELLAVSIFILTALRSKHLSASDPESPRLKRLTRTYLHVAFLVLVLAGFANVLGYLPLSITAGNGMLESSYLAVILYPAVRIIDALALSALSIRPLSRFGMVRRHKDLLYGNVTTIVRWAVFALWLVAALNLFSLYEPLLNKLGSVLGQEHHWGSLNFDLGSVLAFPLTVWASFLLSRFIRFALEEEVYPHLQLGRGIPYAASTMVHYLILVLGFFIAVKAGGADLSQFSFLAGAFGVGLGFGLQNIFNNFISGIILLFERPIKVGDDIQIDATTVGRVERIGIRASVILLANGSELIVPNGNLISNPVTNWTLSNCERLIEIPVTITSKIDPAHIQTLLTAVAAAHPNVVKNPAPHTHLVTIGASLGFKVRAWIDSEEEWMKITSELSLAIHAALARENIVLG